MNKRLVILDNTKLVTNPAQVTEEAIRQLRVGCPLQVADNSNAVIFTSNTPITNYEVTSDVLHEATILEATTLYDTYLDKTDFVVTLDCPSMKRTQLQLIGAGEQSVYKDEVPHIVIAHNIALNDTFRTYMRGVQNLLTEMSAIGKVTLYFRGEELVSSASYVPDEAEINTPNTLQSTRGTQRV